MASSSLSDFPSEMILGIYECLDDHHAVTALNLTSRKFYDVWRLHTAIITKAVLPHVIDCFDLAQELVVIQVESSAGQAEAREAVLQRSKCLLANAATVLRDHSSFRITLYDSCKMVETAYQGDLLAFTESHYRLWILLELLNNREVRDLRLQAATMKELQGMADALQWLLLKLYHQSYSPFVSSVHHSHWTFKALNLTKHLINARFASKKSLS